MEGLRRAKAMPEISKSAGLTGHDRVRMGVEEKSDQGVPASRITDKHHKSFDILE
jgi:hypothetical protein